MALPQSAYMWLANVARDCALIDHPSSIHVLATNHPVKEYELVLSARAPPAVESNKKLAPKVFATRAEADRWFMAGSSH